MSCSFSLFFLFPLAAHFGWSKTKTKFPVNHPPAVKLQSSVRLSIHAAAGAQDAGPVVRSLLQTALVPSGVSVADNAGQEIVVTVNQLMGHVADKTLSKSVNVRTGTKTKTDSKGRSSQEAVCEYKTVNVQQREWNGASEIIFQVRDLKTGVALVTRTLKDSYSKEALTSGPNVEGCYGTTYGVPQDAPADAGAIRANLLKKAVENIKNDLLGWTETREAFLAVCDELKPGNTKAQAGDLAGAVEAWQTARVVNTKHLLPYRDFNLAVGYMLLASGESDLEEALKKLEESDKHFQAAMAGNPTEKYFKEFPADYEQVKTVVVQRKRDSDMQAQATAHIMAEAERKTKWLREPLDPARFPEGEAAEQQQFRKAVRSRLQFVAEGEETSPALNDEFGRYAVRYGISPGDRSRIIADEQARQTAVRQALKDYENSVRGMMSTTGRRPLTPEQRGQLDSQITILNLTPEMVQAIERELLPAASAPATAPKRTPARSLVKPK